MSAFTFRAAGPPFRRWMGPFSPSRGKYTGFRCRNGEVGVWVATRSVNEWWPIKASRGATSLYSLVRDHWDGGRILLLPNGLVIKPLQESDTGQRVVIGRWDGAITLERPIGDCFDMSDPSGLQPGDRWFGPPSAGLESTLRSDGSLACTWYHPDPLGRIEESDQLYDPDRNLANGFRARQIGDSSGRVHVTPHGLVVTKANDAGRRLTPRYVGRVDPQLWPENEGWIR